ARDQRGVAARQRDLVVAARPDQRRARERPRARGLRGAGVGLGRGALDDQGRDRRGRAGAGAVDRAVPALQLARTGRLRGPAPVRAAFPVRRTRREEMKLEVFADADVVARRGAERIAAAARAAVAARGSFALALSARRTPWGMLRALAGEELPWSAVHVFQVDERIAPAGDPDRNLTNLRASLAGAPLPNLQIHAMPVEAADLEAAAHSYARRLPAVLDLVHLGLGADGH